MAQFRAQSPERDDFAAVNVGQLKNVAAPIYRRLIQARYATSFPWNDAAAERDDFAAVNVGQLKQVFSFDLNRDSDEDHMPDLWEVTNGLNPQSPADATGDPDSDGITNLQEFSAGTDPQEHTIAPDTRPWAAIDWTHLDGVTFDFDPCGGSLLTRFRSDATPPSVASTHAALLRGDGGIRFKIAESGASFVLGFSQPPVNSVSLTPVYGFNVSTTGVTYFHPGGSAQLSSSVFLNAVSVQTSDVFCIERIRNHLVYSINGVPLLTIPAPPGKLGIVAQLNSVGLAAGCCEAWGHRPDINNDSMDDLWVQELLSSHPEVTPGSFTPESDADGDGLTNLEEFLNYLDPFNSDSNGDLVPDSFAINTADVDKDGLPAGAESFYGLNDSDPADAWADLDGDGLANLREYLDRTNLNTPAAQIVDSDGDGMSDLFELRYWPTTSGSSYSAAMDFFNSVADSDADGVLNFEEAAFALDPLNRQTRPGSASDTLVLASHLPAGSTTGGSLPARQGYLDWDNDGLPDWKEHWANRYAVTQPAAPAVPPAPNTYHPSLPPYRSDPRTPQNPAALTDSDSDGVSDYMEVQNGSNPFNPDTDGDGTGDVFDGATYFPLGDPTQCVVLDTTYRQVERRFFSGLDVMIGGINTETNFGWFGYEAPAGSDPGGWKMSYPYWDLGTGYKSSRTISASGASVADMITLTELSMAAASQNCRVVYQHPWQTSAYCGAGTFTPGADFPTPTPPVSITSWAYGRSHMVLHFTTPEAAEARAGLTVQAIYTASDLDMFHDPNATATVTQHLQVPIGPDLRSAHYLRSPTPINTDASANSSGSTPETPEILARTSSLWITPTQPVPGLLSMNNATDEGWLLSNGEPINNRDWPATSNPGTGDWRTNNLNKAGGGISTTGLVEVPFLGIIPGSKIPQPWLIYEKVTPGHPLYDPENSQQQLHELAPTMTVNQSGTGRIRLYAVRDQGMTSEAVWEIPIPVGLATTIDLFPMLYSGRTTANTTPPVDTIPYGPNVRYWVEAVNSGPCKLHYGIKRVKTDGSGFEHHWEENTFVSLLPVEIVPDFNRDGKIDAADKGKVSSQKPWRWWINDDADDTNSEFSLSDTPGYLEGVAGLRPNHAKPSIGPSTVNGISDLPDFFPVQLEIRSLIEVFPPSDSEYRITHPNGAIHWVETGLSTNNVRAFLTDPDTTDQLKNAMTRDTAALAPSTLSTNFLASIYGDPAKGILLIEGAATTTEPLQIEIWRGGAKQLVIPFHLSIKGIEEMFRWVNLRGVANLDPASNSAPIGAITRPTNITEPPNRPDSETNDKHFVMVHGYNVAEDDARGWGAEVFKRLYQLGMNSKFTMVTWQGNTSQALGVTANYWQNVTNAFITSPHLKSAVDSLPGTKVIAAHSLGNMVVCSAIKDHGLMVEKYFMLDAAVPLEAFDSTHRNRDEMRNPSWQNYNEASLWPYWASDWHLQFPETDGRSKLTWRSRFGNIPNAINYYSSGEEVLQNGDGAWPTAGATHAWVYQEMGKGRGDTLMAQIPGVVLQGGWGFNHHWEILLTSPDGEETNTYRVRTAQELQAIPLSDTVQNPFFGHFQLAALHDPAQGSATASQYWPRAHTLGGGVPSLSFPAGSNPISTFELRNFDLMDLQDGWPLERPEMPGPDTRRRWHHSDTKDVALRYNHRLFTHWINQENLK